MPAHHDTWTELKRKIYLLQQITLHKQKKYLSYKTVFKICFFKGIYLPKELTLIPKNVSKTSVETVNLGKP